MAQILVRNLDDRVVERLKIRAQRDGRSLQSEVKMILEQAAKADMAGARELAEAIRKKMGNRSFDDSAKLIREDRDR